MATIVTRAGKGSPLTHNEVDANFTNLNGDKLEASNNLSDLDDAATAVANLGITASASELNILDGATLSTAELNILDGVTATTAELNILDGATVTTAELNILDGVTATTAELNQLDGNTLTADLTIPDKIIHSGDTDTSIRFPAADTVTVETAGSERVRVDSGGNVGIGTSSPSQALDVVGNIEVSGGVYLGGTAAANLLDDYEEGTWTPTLAGGFSSAPTSYTFNAGTYTKIGRYVYFALDLQASGATADGSALSIGGLPFANIAAGFGGASYSYQVNFNTISTDIYHITLNSSVISVYDVAGVSRAGNAAGININSRVILFGSYQTAS